MLCVGGGRQGGGGHGIEESGAVEMHRHTVRRCHGANPFDGGEGIDGATSGIMRVFETDERGLDAMRIFWPDGRLHLLRLHDAAVSGHPVELYAGEGPGCSL